jgi:hypothetical protein
MTRGSSFRILTAVIVMMAVFLSVFYLGTRVEAAPEPPQAIDTSIQTVAEALKSAAGWLASTHQNADGGFTSFSMGADAGASDVGGTLDALLALSSAGADVESQLAYLRGNLEQVSEYAAVDGSHAGKIVLSLASAGEDPRDFGGQNFVISLTVHLSPTGQYGVNTAFNQSLAILGLVAANEPVPELALEWLLSLQAREGDLSGSWSDGFGTDGNTDSTAMAMMALMASGYSDAEDALGQAIDFLGRSQLQTGGWEYATGFGENVNSTALVLQALLMAGEGLATPDSEWIRIGAGPLAELLSWQGESGAFQADFGDGRFDDFFSTVQTIPALAAVVASGEQIFVPAVIDESSSEQDSTEEPAPTESPEESEEAESLQQAESSQQEPPTKEVVVSEETEPESEEDNGGFSLCGAPLGLLVFAGMVVLVPKRRRR